MRVASLPYNEELRLQDLYSYDILDSKAEKEFDDLLELASEICKCPIAAITFIDNERQWLKSRIGLEENQTPRDVAFCSHTILQDEVLQVSDALRDERFCDNPLVKEELFIRFYAGAPIISDKGYNLGAVCVIDQTPRELSPEQQKMLTIVSGQVSRLLELRLKNKLIKRQSEAHLTYEKALFQKTLQKQEIEKKSISSELHENIAQSIAATRFYLDIAEGEGPNQKELIRKSKDILTNTLHDVQGLSRLISPSTLKEIYLKESLQYLLDHFSKKNCVQNSLIYEATREIKPDIAIMVYRIVEEQLNNVETHAKASHVSVNVQVSGSIYLTIKDNGQGIELDKFQRGVGINKILSRVENYTGTVDISSGLGEGTELRVMIPLHEKAAVVPAGLASTETTRNLRIGA